MEKEEAVQLIKSRIISEHKKHPSLDWETIAAMKIYSELFEPKKTDDGHIRNQG